MPAIRPEAISNRIRLTYEVRGSVRAFVSEHGAVDTVLSAVVDEVAPNKEGVSALGSQDEFFAWADEQFALPSVLVLVGRIVSFIEGEAV
jgi:hypothetical protein